MACDELHHKITAYVTNQMIKLRLTFYNLTIYVTYINGAVLCNRTMYQLQTDPGINNTNKLG